MFSYFTSLTGFTNWRKLFPVPGRWLETIRMHTATPQRCPMPMPMCQTMARSFFFVGWGMGVWGLCPVLVMGMTPWREMLFALKWTKLRPHSHTASHRPPPLPLPRLTPLLHNIFHQLWWIERTKLLMRERKEIQPTVVDADAGILHRHGAMILTMAEKQQQQQNWVNEVKSEKWKKKNENIVIIWCIRGRKRRCLKWISAPGFIFYFFQAFRRCFLAIAAQFECLVWKGNRMRWAGARWIRMDLH